MIEQAARIVRDRYRGPEDHAGLPQELRPQNLAQAYGVQQAVSRELGAIGGWQICPTGSAPGLASAPLPLGTLYPEPGQLAIARNRRLELAPALAFRIGRSLAGYDAPFGEGEVAAAIESTHPAVLVLDADVAGNTEHDPLTAIAESCAAVSLVYGKGAPGLPGPEMLEVSSTRWFGGKHKRILGTVQPGNLLPPLRWLANVGAVWGGGLLVGQMVALALATEKVPVEAGAWMKLVIGRFGKVDIRTGQTAP
ncbi:MAG: hypothetical protein ACREFP_03425 [Acetobacteraceae bacterium]